MSLFIVKTVNKEMGVKKMEKEDIAYKIIRRTLIVSILIVGLMLLLAENFKEISLGFIFGSIISVLNFLLLNNSVKKSVKMTPDKAGKYAGSQYLIRMSIYGVVLIIGAKANYLNFFTLCLGLLVVKIVIRFSAILDKSFFS